jgi:hypothetical protein
MVFAYGFGDHGAAAKTEDDRGNEERTLHLSVDCVR